LLKLLEQRLVLVIQRLGFREQRLVLIIQRRVFCEQRLGFREKLLIPTLALLSLGDEGINTLGRCCSEGRRGARPCRKQRSGVSEKDGGRRRQRSPLESKAPSPLRWASASSRDGVAQSPRATTLHRGALRGSAKKRAILIQRSWFCCDALHLTSQSECYERTECHTRHGIE
jgi:hypothetical protein